MCVFVCAHACVCVSEGASLGVTLCTYTCDMYAYAYECVLCSLLIREKKEKEWPLHTYVHGRCVGDSAEIWLANDVVAPDWSND